MDSAKHTFVWVLVAFLVGSFVTYCLTQDNATRRRCSERGGIYAPNEGGSSPLCIVDGGITIAH